MRGYSSSWTIFWRKKTNSFRMVVFFSGGFYPDSWLGWISGPVVVSLLVSCPWMFHSVWQWVCRWHGLQWVGVWFFLREKPVVSTMGAEKRPLFQTDPASTFRSYGLAILNQSSVNCIEQGFYSMVKETTQLEYSKEHCTWSENVLHFLFHVSPERQRHWMG